MVEVNTCPVCGSAQFHAYLTCIDYALTKEPFNLKRCTGCSLVVTSPRPADQHLARYYQFPSYVSHTGKTESGLTSGLYKVARFAALRWKRKLVEKYHPVGQILDVGCGTGEFLHTMKLSGWDITGIEPSDEARKKAENLVQQKIHSSIDQVPASSFDVIALWHVLEHLTDLNTAMHTLRYLLKPGGMLFIAVPNHASYDAEKYGAHWAGYDVPRHLWHFIPTCMTRLFTNNNLTLVQTIPMKLDAYYVSLLSENYINKEQPVRNLLRAFFTGLLSNLKARKQVNYSSLIFIATATQK